jgi:IS5 family transposase
MKTFICVYNNLATVKNMVFKEEPKETRFVLSKDVYSYVISEDHLLSRINEEIEFSFVNVECKDMYDPEIGREVCNYPEMMFRAEIIQYMYELSERRLR